MSRITRCFSLVVVTAVTAVLFAPTPAAAQFEEPIDVGEEFDSVDIAVTPDGDEWWVAERDGEVSTAPLGDVEVRCEPPSLDRGYIVAVDRTATGSGYWLVSSYGEVFTCGDAEHFGDVMVELEAPIADIAATPDGGGYFLAAQDGGVFTFGNAVYRGSAATFDLAAPVVGIANANDEAGYWLVATDGGVFTFGDATFHGSAGNIELHKPIVDMTRSAAGHGYYLVAEDGGVFTFGAATFYGSRWSRDDAAEWDRPFVGIEFAWTDDGYFLVDNRGHVITFGNVGE